MRKVLFVTAAVLAAVIFFALATLPPKPLAVDASAIDPDLVRRTVRGAYHIHTSRSDGASDKPTIAAAAARAGLKFIILTDHGDGTAPADPPQYLSGVLCIDAVEISTNGGHYVALGLSTFPYPLGGEPSAVVEDVARVGAFGIVAHPDSPKASLAWSDWDAPFNGIEWLNADSEWRDESRTTLARTFLSYLFRPGPALASMLDRPRTLQRWDELTQRRQVVALAAHDAHGGIGRGVEESGARKQTLGHVPSYEASFRTFTDNVIVTSPLTGDAVSDARGVLDGIQFGRVFTVIDALASPGFIDMRAEKGTMSVKAAMPPGAEIVLVQNGRETQRATVSDVVFPIQPDVRTARIEIRVPGAPGTRPIPWLVYNPVYYFSPTLPPPVPTPSAEIVALPRELAWHVEKDPRTVATSSSAKQQVSMEYTLAPGAKASQFAALSVDLNGSLARITQLVFSGSAARPARVSVQLRYRSRGGERWGSSVYLDSNPREVVVPIDRLRPLDRQSGPVPDPANASSLLFVADLTNAKPGDSNSVRIANLRIGR